MQNIYADIDDNSLEDDNILDFSTNKLLFNDEGKSKS